MRTVTAAERPDLIGPALDASDAVWPEFNKHGDVLHAGWMDLWTVVAGYQLMLLDDEDRLMAVANSLPCSWDGTMDGLPSGIDDVFAAGLALAEAGLAGDTLSALAIVVLPGQRGAGLSQRMIRAMVDVAAAQGWTDVIVPLRPTWKERYPLTPIERYVTWVRADGMPFDPWLRTHVRLGGEVLRPAPESLRVTGSVGDWEEWTEMAFPDDGPYVIPGGLALLSIDHGSDTGAYWEPNVWVRHRVRQA